MCNVKGCLIWSLVSSLGSTILFGLIRLASGDQGTPDLMHKMLSALGQ